MIGRSRVGVGPRCTNAGVLSAHCLGWVVLSALVRQLLGVGVGSQRQRFSVEPCGQCGKWKSGWATEERWREFCRWLRQPGPGHQCTGSETRLDSEAVTRQSTFNLGGLSEENWIRIQEQNEKPTSVIIGNPPYNANQKNENDNNRNREYPAIDRRIRETYIDSSTAQKTKQYDMYKRFIRWASDRLADDGIVAFITNRSYLEARQDDGFRKVAAGEFTDIYVMDLGSDVRRNPKISGTTHNVFGIQTGVAITFLVREKSRMGECNIHYASREDAEVARDKLAYLKGEGLENIPFETITPDAKGNWLNQSNSNFEQLIPLADPQTKLAKSTEEEQAVFGLHSLGVATNRYEWTYDFDVDVLSNKVRFFCATYQKELRRFAREKPVAIEVGNWVDRSIKWTSELEAHLAKGHALDFSSANITPSGASSTSTDTTGGSGERSSRLWPERTASPPRRFSPTPTRCSTTRSTASNMPWTCCESFPDCPCTATSTTGPRWATGCWTCILDSSQSTPFPWNVMTERGLIHAGPSCGRTRSEGQ